MDMELYINYKNTTQTSIKLNTLSLNWISFQKQLCTLEVLQRLADVFQDCVHF